MEEQLCLAGIVVRGSTRWCELPKYHEGSHFVKGENFEIKWEDKLETRRPIDDWFKSLKSDMEG
jgi:hypothetical protein